jgi:hypothetical protein
LRATRATRAGDIAEYGSHADEPMLCLAMIDTILHESLAASDGLGVRNFPMLRHFSAEGAHRNLV